MKDLASYFPLPWSAYVRLLGVKNDPARKFYETEALRGGWYARSELVEPKPGGLRGGKLPSSAKVGSWAEACEINGAANIGR
jgi:hypothetical protein